MLFKVQLRSLSMRTILLQEMLKDFMKSKVIAFTPAETVGKNLKSRKEMNWMFIKIYTVDRFGQQKRKFAVD